MRPITPLNPPFLKRWSGSLLFVLVFVLPGFASDRAVETFCRFVPEREDDFAWENDKIAFRAYGPALRARAEDSGFDCWLKRVDYPIVNKWYAKNAAGKSYHKDEGWLAIWETIDDADLGVGLVLDPARIDAFRLLETGKPLGDEAVIISKTDARGQLEYHAGYGWEKGGEMTNSVQWNGYLEPFAKTIFNDEN